MVEVATECGRNSETQVTGEEDRLLRIVISFMVGYIDMRLSRRKGMFHPSQYHVRPFSGLHGRKRRVVYRGYQATARRKRVLYFFWPVAPERVSEMLWPALPRAS